jgi:hypothetical protein
VQEREEPLHEGDGARFRLATQKREERGLTVSNEDRERALLDVVRTSSGRGSRRGGATAGGAWPTPGDDFCRQYDLFSAQIARWPDGNPQSVENSHTYSRLHGGHALCVL